ncbi:MAG: carboxypeptidase-like regulatory domain-containing protein [Raineya sp.]|nr:carboxypeptidase-like regulatory domain-containing protein [Raineya sp.]
MRSIVVLLLLCSIQISFAQVVIEGSLQDSKEAVVNATVLLYAPHSEKILLYTFTDSKGKFRLTLTPTTDSLEIEIRHISYEKIRQKIPATSQKLNFTLKESVSEIKEIEVKVNPVTIRNDTTTYNVRSFASQADRNIKDVLAKMPGVEITDNGLIKYKGKPISKFYIDNLDMLGKRYNLASENVPWDMVDEVEFYENHQDIKLLDSLGIKGSNPALNLRLNPDAKKRITLAAETGVGIPFLLWDAKTTAFKFFQKHQFLNILQSNNIGKDLEKELTEHSISLEQILLRRFPHQRNDLLQVAQIANPPLEKNRYIFNQSASSSLNGIVQLPNSAQLRYHFTYLYQNNQNRNESRQQLFFLQDTITINEKQSFTQKQHLLQGELQYEKNLKSLYTKNVFTAKKFWESQVANASLFGLLNVAQDLKNPYWQIQNEFQTYRWQGSKIVQWVSNSYLKFLPQRLQVSPNLWQVGSVSPERTNFLQEVSGFRVESENFRSSTTEWQKLLIRTQTGIKVAYRRLESKLLLQSPEQNKDSLGNNLQDYSYQLFANLNAERKIGRRSNFNFNAEYTPLALWQNTEIGLYNNFFHQYSSRVMFSQKWGSWTLSGGGGFSQNIEEETHWFNTQGIFRNYRSIFENGLLVPQRNNWQVMAYVFYNDVLNGWSWNSDVSLLNGYNNYRYAIDYRGILENRQILGLQTPFETLIANTRFNKYFYSARSNLSVSGMLIQNKSLQRQNNQDFTSNFQNWQTETKFTCNYWSFLNLSYQGRLNVFQTALNTQITPPNLQIRHQISVGLQLKRWLITTKTYHLTSMQQNQRLSNYFVDMSLQRKFERLEAELQIFNLTNQNSFTLAQVQENILRETFFELRPFNLLLKVYWRM